MEIKKNSHVERLVNFIPFGPGISEIVTELQKETQKLDIKTQAIDFVTKIVKEKSKALIVLTGNAGHGKTYICQKILMSVLGMSDQDAKKALRNQHLGDRGLESPTSSCDTIRIFKDMSELDSKTAALCLHESLDQNRCVTIACVNEGKLREILSIDNADEYPNLNKINCALASCVDEGFTGFEDELFFVNLNFQSVVANGRNSKKSFLEEAFQSWLNDERSWSSCKDCIAMAQGCPIYNNRNLLTMKASGESGAIGEKRARGIIHLFKMAELFGQTITVREMLIVLAYIVTGHLDCSKVHERFNKQKKQGWQSEFAFYHNVFAENLQESQLDKVPLLRCFRKFDPSRIARREVDDRFILGFDIDTKQSDLFFIYKDDCYNALEQGTGLLVTSSGSEAGSEEADLMLQAIKRLRRRDFFDLWTLESLSEVQELKERAKRIGYSSLADMVWLTTRSKDEDKQRLVRIKNDIVAGLHAIQGLSPWNEKTNLLVTHPAFARLQRKVNLINGTVTADKIKFLKRCEVWERKLASDRLGLIGVDDTVDYIEREVVLSVEDEELPLNLERFEYLRKAGLGYLSRVFFQTDIRRILNFLAKVAVKIEQKDDSNNIIISTPEKQYQLAISEGLIQ
ncbi:hypothetical protein [Desulforhopalus singaporensis]|uniref:Uncharacterized protein n=1 Tax=Desulforhopalus singaporensis TaxID=91360 RepID=A0A1H0U601_9BACT|nr:hypothetical protein [Desulforhopalus singaporensis]SDP61415.1 hypothetical protein SAMN05660330_03387 [Desulforhopalus singaporensis]